MQHPSISTRFKHLGFALSIFYLLYNVTTAYSVSLYNISPSSVHSLATPFDNFIPFIPVMIVPYSWSLILFVASFFLVRTSKQLSLLTYRLILATIFACVIFYLYPARFSFYRPTPDGWTQFGYQFLQLVDKPFNQLPSLHVGYAILLGVSLWQVAASKTYWAVFYRLLLVSVCTLIALSTVLTYQHHLLDVLGGAVLAAVILILVNRIRNGLVIKHLALGSIGFLLIAIAGFYLSEMSTIASNIVETLVIIIALYWLVSFVMLACAYQQIELRQSNSWFEKTSHGRLTVSTWVKFAPIIVIYHVMSVVGQWYVRIGLKEKRYLLAPYAINDTIQVVASPRLTRAGINRHLTYWLSSDNSVEFLYPLDKRKQSTHYQMIVIDVAAEISSHVDTLEIAMIETTNSPAHTHYLYLSLLDLQPLNEVSLTAYIDLFEQINALIPSAERYAITANNEHPLGYHPITLINFHCVMGLSRSIGVQVLYLLYCGVLTVHNYQSWLAQYYPHAHLKDDYLPPSLVEAVAHYDMIKHVAIS